MMIAKDKSALTVAREARGWSLAQMAELLGLSSKSYLSDVENGRRPSLPVAIGLYRHLGVKSGPIADLTDHEIAILEKTLP